jgi:alkaline phosphatase D
MNGGTMRWPLALVLGALCSAAAAQTLTNTLGMRFVQIPAGSFTMGLAESDAALARDFPALAGERITRLADERPAHRVRIGRAFWLGQHEVTVGQFRAFVAASGHVPESVADGSGGYGYDATRGPADGDAFAGRDRRYSWRDPGFVQGDDHPVVNVTWNDAQAFMRWLSAREGVTYRLPTEAEWEYACRAGAHTRYQHGDDPATLAQVANLFDADALVHWRAWPQWAPHALPASDGHAWTAPVGSYAANRWGLHDMHGNVWEWVADWYGEHYYARAAPRPGRPGDRRGARAPRRQLAQLAAVRALQLPQLQQRLDALPAGRHAHRAAAAMSVARRRVLLAAAAAIGLPRFVPWARAAPSAQRFALGVASGCPRADGMVLWTRVIGASLPDAVEVEWEVAHDEAFTRIAARGTETADADWAHSVHAEPAGLEPGRWYWYRFQALGQRSAAGRTRTAPAADDAAATLRFVSASCQRWDHGHYAAWRDAVAHDPDLIVFLGDYIYEYGAIGGRVREHTGRSLATLDDYRTRHALYKSDPLLRAAHAAAPWALVWDDHEVENDYAALTPMLPRPGFAAQRAAAYQAYWEHLPLPKAARPQGGTMPMAARIDWGRLARLHLLDTRQHRDAQACPRPGRGGSARVRRGECAALADPARSLLGAAQERWLADGWDLARPWNLVAQTTLMARTAGLGDDASVWTDGWDGYPAARERLLGAVQARRVPGVVVLGGDVHAHVVADLHAQADNPRSPVVASEFCVTSISSHATWRGPFDTLPHLRYGSAEHRGSMRFTLDAKALHAELRGVAAPDDPASASTTLARYVVDARRPGPVAA